MRGNDAENFHSSIKPLFIVNVSMLHKERGASLNREAATLLYYGEESFGLYTVE